MAKNKGVGIVDHPEVHRMPVQSLNTFTLGVSLDNREKSSKQNLKVGNQQILSSLQTFDTT